jgi:hypothetical protein
MLKICTVYFKGFYTPDYVSKLYRSLKRNSTVPFEFICLSDTNDIEADVILPYNHHSDIKKHWHKLKFFSPQFGGQKPGDDIIIMDIDQVIVGNVDELLGHSVKENELVSYGQWWDNKLKLNGGFYKFKSGSLKSIWDDFSLNPHFWQLHYYNTGVVHHKYYGEQNYVNWKVQQNNIKLTLTPREWLGRHTDNTMDNVELNKIYSKKFNTDYMILDKPHKYIKVIHFTGVGKTIHQSNAKFIKDNWYE